MSTVRVVCILFASTALVGAIACSGGGGGMPGQWDGWDYQTGKWDDRERPQSGLDNVFPSEGREVPPISGDPAPNGGGSLNCPSFFQCEFSGPITICISGSTGSEAGTSEQCTTTDVHDFSFPVALENKDGVCVAGDAIFEPGGALLNTKKGGAPVVVARWFVNGSTLVLTNGQVTLVCQQTATLGKFTGGSSDDEQTASSSGANGGSSSSSTSSGSTTVRDASVIVIDAGQ